MQPVFIRTEMLWDFKRKVGDILMTAYSEREDEAYTRLRQKLLKEKGSEFQQEFLVAIKHSEDFLKFMDTEARATDGDFVKQFTGPLTEQSFKEPTQDQEQAMYKIWSVVPPRTACRVSFWAEVTIQHIRSGVIKEAYWLAGNTGRNETGEERIDRALALKEDNPNRQIDDCVRTVIRRMSGLPSDRGNRSVFVNPSFGRAWWRERMVARILSRKDVEDRSALLNVIRSSQQYWENLVTMIVSRGSVLGSVDVQDAFVNGLAKHFKDMPSSPIRTANKLTVALRRLSNIAASRELGVLEFGELAAIVDKLLNHVFNELNLNSKN